MLRALEHPLLSSAVGSLIGAVDGGVSSYYVATENSQNQFVMGAYTDYLTEAARALSFANSAEITDQEKKRLGRATAVLAMTASDEVLCRAVNFENEMSSVKPSASDEYFELMAAMRKETLGEENLGGIQLEDCKFSLMS